MRTADLQDVPALIKMFREFHRTSPFAHFAFAEEKIRGLLAAAIIDPSSWVVLVSVDGDKIVGCIVGMKQIPVFSTDVCSLEVCWWLEPEYRNSPRGLELLDGYIEWAKLIGVQHINTALLAGYDHDVGRIMKIRGFRHSEQGFTKEA